MNGIKKAAVAIASTSLLAGGLSTPAEAHTLPHVSIYMAPESLGNPPGYLYRDDYCRTTAYAWRQGVATIVDEAGWHAFKVRGQDKWYFVNPPKYTKLNEGQCYRIYFSFTVYSLDVD